MSTDLYSQHQTGVDTLTHQMFMMAISIFTTMNIAVSAVGASFTYGLAITNGWLLLAFFGACLIASVGGAFIAHSNDDPMTSIVGGFICAGAMGVMVGPFVSMFPAGKVIQALALTTMVVVFTGMVGAVIPKDLSAWGAPLFAGILGLIGVSIVGPLVSGPGVITILDYAGILLFSAVMVYDMNMAQRMDRTMNNAIDVAVNVFLNFANIFIRVLSLMGDD